MIDRARLTVRNGLGETRRALKALRASPLDDLGLALALQRLADDAGERGNIIIEAKLPNENPDWSKNLEEGAYRIAQEALENIVRHAQASRVELELRGDNESLKLIIGDNGRGFEVGQYNEDGRYGLRGMNERASSLGGILSVESRSGKGTVIMFTWEAHNAGSD